jgi:hypothetical protein
VIRRTLWLALYLAACLGVVAIFVACNSTAKRDKAAHAVRVEIDAVLKSHGIVMTPEEQQRLHRRLVDLEDSSSFDWPMIGATAGAVILGLLPVLRFIPNRYLIGPVEAAALDKAAGF